MGRSLDDVRAVVLTHGDTDHIGFAERLRRERGVPVYVHELDAGAGAWRGQEADVRAGVRSRSARSPGSCVYAARHGGLRIPPLTEVVTFGDGATLDLPGLAADHPPARATRRAASRSTSRPSTPSSWATRSRPGASLTGEVGPRLAPFTLDPAQALASLAKLDAIDATWVLPGHGEPWTAASPRRCD